MKSKFEGEIYGHVPEDWRGAGWLARDVLTRLEGASDTPFRLVAHKDYICTEYDMALDMFTFGQLKLKINFTVIGLPLSVDCVGFEGSLDALIQDYRRRKGIFLVLNLSAPRDDISIAQAVTLPSCVFENNFPTFEGYVSALRSGYRRRLNIALEKGAGLDVRKIENGSFCGDLYGLYVQVLARSKYPLETLNIQFFRRFDGEIFVFYEGGAAVAFVALRRHEGDLQFVFGGMDYSRRDRLDLYSNMLIFVLRHGIETGAQTIYFGQTAEDAKMRLGCFLRPRYMAAFSSNRAVNWLLRVFGAKLGYKEPQNAYRVFREDG